MSEFKESNFPLFVLIPFFAILFFLALQSGGPIEEKPAWVPPIQSESPDGETMEKSSTQEEMDMEEASEESADSKDESLDIDSEEASSETMQEEGESWE